MWLVILKFTSRIAQVQKNYFSTKNILSSLQKINWCESNIRPSRFQVIAAVSTVLRSLSLSLSLATPQQQATSQDYSHKPPAIKTLKSITVPSHCDKAETAGCEKTIFLPHNIRLQDPNCEIRNRRKASERPIQAQVWICKRKLFLTVEHVP